MASISSIIHDCLKRFYKLLTSDTIQQHASEISGDSWRDELGRLRVRAANVGPHQTGQSSLDFRLRDSSNIKDNLIRLLKGLQEAFDDLEEVLQEQDGNPISAKDNS